MPHESDADDARLFEDGDIAALLAKYDPVIRGRCAARLRGHVDADDVAQNVKLRLLAEFRRGRTYPVPFRVVVSRVVDWTVKDYFEGRPTDQPLPDDWAPAQEGHADAVADGDYVGSLLASLPGRQREVWTLHLHGLDRTQIAAVLGIEPNAVDQALHNGRKKLRMLVGDA